MKKELQQLVAREREGPLTWYSRVLCRVTLEHSVVKEEQQKRALVSVFHPKVNPVKALGRSTDGRRCLKRNASLVILLRHTAGL